MARNGSGTYSLPQAPFVSGTVISSTAVNSDFSDIATALTQSIASDGQTPITANLPMSGYKHTGVANASARTDYAATGQVQDGSFTWCGTAGGTADALTLTPTPAITAYATGQKFRFKAGSGANTGATTVAISGLTTKAIQLNDAALAAGDIAANKYYEILYDGTAFQLSRVSIPTGSDTSPGLIEIATTAETQTGTDATRAVSPAGLAATAVYQGKHTIWVPATAMVSRTTNGAASGTSETATNDVMLSTLNFDATTQEFAQFTVAFPNSWNEGTVTAQFFWSHPSTTTNFGVVFQLAGVAISNDDALDTAFGTAQTATDTGGTTDDLYVSPETSAITIAGTPAAGDLCFFQVSRDPGSGSDTLAVDARLHGIKLYYTVNAKDDA